MTRTGEQNHGMLPGAGPPHVAFPRKELRRIHRRAKKLVAGLDIPVPFDLQKLCVQIGDRRGTSIHLHPFPIQLGGLCGVVISVNGADHIIYESQTSPLHQHQIILHELGHLLGDHRTGSDTLTEATARLIFPDLDPAMVKRHLRGARGHYSDPEDLEAEIIASMILQRARRARSAPARTMYSDIADRVEHALG